VAIGVLRAEPDVVLDGEKMPAEAAWRKLLVRASAWAIASPDPSTQNGALLVDEAKGSLLVPLDETFAVNEFPRGVDYFEERWERPLKYSIVEHAERNAIYQAARVGIRTAGLTLVCPWAACSDCARGIVQSGITRLVTLAPRKGDTPVRWHDTVGMGMIMLNEAGVEVTFIDGPLDAGFTILRDGRPYSP
jgi:dCMP deaminase